MKKILKVLLFFVLLQSVSYAASYPDVKSTHWANSYIQDMTGLGYLKGYTDGSFKPEDNIKFTELMTVLSKFHSKFSAKDVMDGSATQNAITKYGQGAIDQLKQSLPSWSHNYVIYCLDNGIVNLNELATLRTNKKFEANVNREDTMTYLAKAMQLESKAVQKTVVSLPYGDADKINPIKQKYISVLLDMQILTPEGKVKKGVSGNFYPGDFVTRAEMSKILSLGSNAMGSAAPKPAPVPTPAPDPDPKEQLVPASVSGLITSVSSTSLTVKTEKGATKTFTVSGETKITLEGTQSSISSLKEGQSVEVYYNLVNNAAITLKASSGRVEFEGFISSIGSSSFSVQIGSSQKTFRLDSKSVITYNGKTDSSSKMEVNDKVKGTAIEDIIEKMEVEKLAKYNGVIQNVDSYRSLVDIQYTVGNNTTTRSFPMTDKITVIIDGKVSKFTDLNRGTPVILAVRGDDLVRIEAQKDQTIKGVVKSVESGTSMWLDGKLEVVITSDKKDFKLYADQRTVIRSGGGNFQHVNYKYVNVLPGQTPSGYYYSEPVELKAGDNIEATLIYDYISSFQAWSNQETITGTIQSITTSFSALPSITVTTDGRSRTFQLNSQTKVNGKLYGTSADTQLQNGMQVKLTITNDVVLEISTLGMSSSLVKGPLKNIAGNVLTVYDENTRMNKMIIISSNSVQITDAMGTHYSLDKFYNEVRLNAIIEAYGYVNSDGSINPIHMKFANQ